MMAVAHPKIPENVSYVCVSFLKAIALDFCLVYTPTMYTVSMTG